MTGLYLREVLARRLIRRVLVVPPAGLIGNWERELRMLFSLPFRIVRGADARGGNPFAGPESGRVIVSVDTLVGERTFGRLREAAAPYDLVVFDEAHQAGPPPAAGPLRREDGPIAQAHEDASGAAVHDVSRPELARRAGLVDWPGFDLLSIVATGDRRAIGVKGRARGGDIELSENEWAKACNLRDGYWLYAVYDCATPRPRQVRVRDPFAKLLARSRVFSAYAIPAASVQAAAEGVEGTKP